MVVQRKATIAEAKAAELARLQQEEMERQLELVSSIPLPEVTPEEASLAEERVIVSSEKQQGAVSRFFNSIGAWFSSRRAKEASQNLEGRVVVLPTDTDREQVEGELHRDDSEVNLISLPVDRESSIERSLRRSHSLSNLSQLGGDAVTDPTLLDRDAPPSAVNKEVEGTI